MKRHDQEQMLNLYNQWRASGERKTDFAVSQGIRPNTFHYWVKKFEQGNADTSSGFQRISLPETSSQYHGEVLASIHYPTGIRVELHGSFQHLGEAHVHLLKALTEPAMGGK